MSQQTPVQRRGITILEVLIAMGIALFGLLAVMAIVPFAATQARQGLETEDVAALGQRALGDVHTYDLINPERWITAGALLPGGPLDAGLVVGRPGTNSFQSYRDRAYDGSAGAVANDPHFRMFWDEAILIDPLFFHSHLSDPSPISHFPYCYAPQGFVDDDVLPAIAATYREPLLSGTVSQGYTAAGHFGGGDPAESIAPYVRRVGLTNPANTGPFILPIHPVAAREIFESGDDVALRGLTDAERTLVPAFEQLQRTQYFTGFDASNNPVETKVLAEGRTSWLAMLVPEDEQRTTWRLSIIVVRDRDASMSINLQNERVARIRGFARYGVNGHGFLSQGRRGGVVKIESWGTTNFAAADPDRVWHVQEHDIEIAPNQWVLLSQFTPPAVSTQPARRTYRWYRVSDVAGEIIPSDPGVHSNADVGAPVPARLVTLVGPDWDITPDTLVFIMNNVEAVYERTIHVPAGTFPVVP